MADLSTNIPQISFGQADKETAVNELFDAASPSMLFGRNGVTSAGLGFGLLGGRWNGAVVANKVLALTDNSTLYISASLSTGDATFQTGSFKTGEMPLYKVTTSGGLVTDYEDHRAAYGIGIPEAPTDGKQYARKDAGWAEVAASWAGDMEAATYDPQGIEDDAFDRGNHTGTQPMASIGDKQGKVLDDLTPLLYEDFDSAVVPKGYLVSDAGGLLDGAQLFVQQTPEGLVTQTIHVPILGKSGFRTKPVGGAWSDLSFTIAPFDIVGWHDDTTAEAANAVINPDGTFSRSTSSEDYKTGIEPMLDEYADAIVQGAQPIYYRSTCEADPDDWSYWGISAEQLATIDPRLVHWGHDTKDVAQPFGMPPRRVPDLDSPLKPVGVQYSRVVPALLNVVKRQGAAIAALEARISALEGGAA